MNRDAIVDTNSTMDIGRMRQPFLRISDFNINFFEALVQCVSEYRAQAHEGVIIVKYMLQNVFLTFCRLY
jgi:hypothetical protein